MTAGAVLSWALCVAAAEPPEAAETTRLAVIDLEANGVPVELARALTEAVATRTDRTGVFDTVSPVQLSAVVALDKTRWAMGSCTEENCFARLAEAVSAQHAIGGSVSRAGETFAVQLVLVEVESAKALRRVEREATDPSELIKEAGEAAIVLLQPLLQERSGFARVDSNVPGAQLTVNGELSEHRPGQVFPAAAGPHVIKGSLDGFYPTTVDLSVKPSRVSSVQLTLVPSPETVAAYEAEANLMRTTAWITGGVAIAAGIAGAIFYDQASQNLEVVEDYNQLNDIERSRVDAPTGDRSSADTNQGLYITFLSTAVLSGLTSAGLFLFGPDPGRFDEFDDMSAVAQQ